MLAATETELTMRTVASLAGVSVNRAASVLNDLVRLGVVRRRDAGRSALVSLERESEAGRLVAALSEVQDAVLRRLRHGIRSIRPEPASVVLFGSFVAGTATRDSDVDVLVVRDAAVPEDDELWLDSLGRWVDSASRIVGNAVNPVIVAESDVARLVKRPKSFWGEIVESGIVIAGSELRDLPRVA
ncbi:MAG: nucleotidyltransferase domain-containing protein [Acidimicrobiales bacterium]